ncbi:MAG TPA: hypothetical protein VFF70_02840, partial [Anaerolineae bacterium]|nr:hypothetical protein [Anaerolineae bacterium]
MNTKYRQSFFVLTVASFMLVVVVIPWSTKLPSPAAPTSVTDIYNVYYVAPSANCGIGNNPC